MKNTLSFSIFVLLLMSLNAKAAGYFKTTFYGRIPQSMNALGTLAYDRALWGDASQGKENPLYGFASVGTRFGGSPSLSAFVQVAPVSPFVIEAERSFTHRFSRSVNFPCDSVECEGRIDRTDVSARLGGAWNEFVFVGGILWRDIKTMQSAIPVVVELEDMVITPGNHRFVETSAYVARNLDDTQSVGLLYVSGEIKAEERGFQSSFVLYRKAYEDYRFSLGVGNHKSDIEKLNGFRMILSLSRQWGETLSLF